MAAMRRAPGKPELLGNALRHLLRRVDPERRLEVFRLWPAEVGAALAARTAPAALRDGVLTVRVRGAAWMQELQFAKEEIRARLNSRLGADLVRDIYFVADSTAASSPARSSPPAVRTADPGAEGPTEMPALRDPRLAEVFARLAKRIRDS